MRAVPVAHDVFLRLTGASAARELIVQFLYAWAAARYAAHRKHNNTLVNQTTYASTRLYTYGQTGLVVAD